MNDLIPYGMDGKTGRMRHVDEVPNGLNCGCICPNCRRQLVAKQGAIRAHYFSHHASSCEGWLHATAKRLLYERIQDELERSGSIPIVWPCECGISHSDNLLVKADAVELEKYIPGGIKPDITLYGEGEPVTLVEVVYKSPPGERTKELVHRKGIKLAVVKVETGEDLDGIKEGTLNLDKDSIQPCSQESVPHPHSAEGTRVPGPSEYCCIMCSFRSPDLKPLGAHIMQTHARYERRGG